MRIAGDPIENLTELILVCRINSTLKVSNKTKNAIREVLKSAVDIFEFAHAALILVLNGKVKFIKLRLQCRGNKGNPGENRISAWLGHYGYHFGSDPHQLGGIFHVRHQAYDS